MQNNHKYGFIAKSALLLYRKYSHYKTYAKTSMSFCVNFFCYKQILMRFNKALRTIENEQHVCNTVLKSSTI